MASGFNGMKIVKDIIAEMRNRVDGIDRSELWDNGEVFYMNGNDSTEFDWSANNRTCEFEIFWGEKYGGYGLIKAYICKNGKLKGCEWKNKDNLCKGDMIEFDYHMSEDKARRFYRWLVNNFDYKDLWDRKLDLDLLKQIDMGVI